MGLRPARSFRDVSTDPRVRAALASVYASVHEVDAWLGCLAEPHAPGALVGETLRAVLAEQFERLRSGDRFWYQSYLPPELVQLVEEQTLARLLERHAGVIVRGSPFLAPHP